MTNPFYREMILDHYKNPRNFGHLAKKNCSATEANTSCGDSLTFELHINPQSNIVDAVCFSGDGCAISQSSASLLSEKIQGMSIDQVLALTPAAIHELLEIDLSFSREKCALLSLQTVHKAVLSYQKSA